MDKGGNHLNAGGTVFISYAWVDGASMATRLHDDLEHAGIKAFLDERDIREGDVRFKRKVGEASPLCTLQSRANRDGSPTF